MVIKIKRTSLMFVLLLAMFVLVTARGEITYTLLVCTISIGRQNDQ